MTIRIIMVCDVVSHPVEGLVNALEVLLAQVLKCVACDLELR